MTLTPAEKADSLQSNARIADERAQTSLTPSGLPDRPLVVIEPRQLGGSLLRDLRAYHELLYFLTWRDVKVRYKQTLMGIAWAVLQPLFMMLIFALFFGQALGLKTDPVPYPLFAFAGLIPWTFFSTAATTSGNSVVNSANLITKVYFPRLIVPAASVAAALVDFGITLVVLCALMLYYRVAPDLGTLMLAPLSALLVALAFAFGVLMSALNVRYRDVRFVLPFLVQLWFFASPIIYPSSFVQGRFRFGRLLALNPMTGIIDGFRSALFRGQFDWVAIAVSAAVTLALLVCAVVTFRRMERSFADIV